jgi:hypothetical protein
MVQSDGMAAVSEWNGEKWRRKKKKKRKKKEEEEE